MKVRHICRGLAGVLLVAACTAVAQAQTVPVTVDNFIRAESDMYFGKL